MLKKRPLTLLILLQVFSGCASDAWLFPLQHERHKLKIAEAVFTYYLSAEADIYDRIDPAAKNVFFLEQKVPWWKFGSPSRTLIKRIADQFSEKFIIRSVKDTSWADIYLGDEIIDRSPRDAKSGMGGDILSIHEIEGLSNCRATVWLWAHSGEVSKIRYKCDLTLVDGHWRVNSMVVFHNLY